MTLFRTGIVLITYLLISNIISNIVVFNNYLNTAISNLYWTVSKFLTINSTVDLELILSNLPNQGAMF
jgi:hypothetical protein